MKSVFRVIVMSFCTINSIEFAPVLKSGFHKRHINTISSVIDYGASATAIARGFSYIIEMLNELKCNH